MSNIILPGDDSMKGYFAFYHNLDGKYQSRYQIKTKVSGNLSNIYCYSETADESYFRVESELIIHFKHAFVLTNYTFLTSKTHSYPSAWKFD